MSIETPTSAEESKPVIQAIEQKGWWQGSVISRNSLPSVVDHASRAEWWIIASQTCNLYNPILAKVPVIELVGARRIEQCDPAKVRGQDPRILHVEATSNAETVPLEIDILTRIWIPRRTLAEVPASALRLRDKPLQVDSAVVSPKWNDNFSGWLGRSYTRVALPNKFNDAMRVSRIEKSIESKLLKRATDLYGIYFAIDWDSDEEWGGALGEMPPPYILGIVLVVEEHADAELIRLEFAQNLFDNKIQDPENPSNKTTRADLARRNGIRLSREDIVAKNITEVTLYELKGLVRFTMVDHLSDSSLAVAA